MILLDTHVVIWLMTTPERLSKPAAAAIDNAGEDGTRLAISTASVFEILYAKRRNRVQLHVSGTILIKRLRTRFDFLPVTEAVAVEAAAFPEPFHGDPMDRIIAATALIEKCALITRDESIRGANICTTIW
jgi:PIN domain nuclease of toxin-antitoxin system